LPPGYAGIRPALTCVGLDDIREHRQFGLFGRTFEATHQRVRALYEQATHAVGHVGKCDTASAGRQLVKSPSLASRETPVAWVLARIVGGSRL
jgi:hypothetical protein